MKRILTIQDISCIGKCSLTVALPIISAMGIETAIIPTAVLSTHTAFSEFTCKDLDDQIIPICNHFKKEGFVFDGFYTGYLASKQQIAKVIEVIEKLKNDKSIIVVDPAMADNGKLYAGFPEDFPEYMAKLCAKADIIVPNITEACLLTKTEYSQSYTKEFAQDVMKKLAKLGAKKVILTGANFDNNYSVMLYDSVTDEFFVYSHNKIEKCYHGTGDIFSSTFTGALIRGKTVEESIKIAADYTVECIRITEKNKGNWYGVEFEKAIPFLIERIK